MSTLLKAYLLKTDNPFIMLKCYLEDILKEQGLTWQDLVDALEREAKQKTALYDALTFSPELKNALKKLKEIDSGFFGQGKLIEQKITRPTPLTIEIDSESEGEDYWKHPYQQGEATSGKRIRQDPRLKYPKRKKKDGKIIPIEEGGGFETTETEETVEVPPKGAPKISGRKTIEVRDEYGNKKKKIVTGDDPMHPAVREDNIRNFINALKSSPEFKENPTVLQKVVKGLQAILDKIHTLESKEVPKKSRGVKEKGKKSARKLAETRILIQGANRIGELVNDFETAIARADSLDFKGPLIYNVAVEEAVQDLLSSNKAKARLRQYASGELSKDVRRVLEEHGPSDDLLALNSVTEELAYLLARTGINTKNLLAEQSVKELIEIDEINEEMATSMILEAREDKKKETLSSQEREVYAEFLDEEELEDPELESGKKETLENKLKLLDKIESALNSKIKYPALEGMREESVLDAIFYAYNQKTGVVIADLSEHPKISSKMADLKGRVNKKGMSNLLNELKGDPEIQRRMAARREKGIEETEGEKAFAALLSGEKITRN
jgi:transcription termination factor NusA